MPTRKENSRGDAPVTLNGGESNAPDSALSTPSTQPPAGNPEGSATPSTPKGSALIRWEGTTVAEATPEEEVELLFLASLLAARNAGPKD